MQKKINLLSTLLIVALVLGALSTCSGPSFRKGLKEGSERAWVDYAEDNKTAYDRGYAAGEAVRKRLSLVDVQVSLTPKEILDYPDSLFNAKTGERIPASLESVRVGLKDPETPLSWLYFVASVLIVVSVIAFVLMLVVFVVSIKSGGIFLKGNERILRWMGVIFLVWYASDWAFVLTAYLSAKANVELADYIVSFDVPSFFPLVIGISFLLFAQIFAKGRKMEEDQEFMV